MILSSLVNEEALISGTINFLVGSILHADELSITVVPAAANFGYSMMFHHLQKQSNIGCIATAVLILL
jgi:hypothetical protein